MRLPFDLTAVPAVLVAALASASCTHGDERAVAAVNDVARTEAAAGAATSLHPPMQKDPADGPVFEYY